MAGTDKLGAYRDKRDFTKTPEPPPDKGAESSSTRRIFVIQQHAASSMHWDFRIEVDGTLKSWAIPKGPSANPSDKRLAVPTEDHPMSYADFEGNIPEDQYGGGTVIVWDAGRYKNMKTGDEGREIAMSKTIDNGRVEIWLEGKKLRGGFALIRTGKRSDKQPRWLLVKMKDEGADARRNPVNTEPASVISGKTVEEMADGP